MQIPTFWARSRGNAATPDNERELSLLAWGWSSTNQADAESSAAQRLARMVARVVAGDPLPDRYSYGERPIREERLEEHSAPDGSPIFITTRNRYGSLVINAARAMFIDVDLPEAPRRSLLSLFRKAPDPSVAVLDAVRTALSALAPRTFRIYRTAAGFRILALDREYDPLGQESVEIMTAVGADPAYMQLCRVQASFRARLTPKPWRCRYHQPPGQFPREPAVQQRFERWVREYDQASQEYATCRLLEQVGVAGPTANVKPVLAHHDRVTRAETDLPLA